VWALCRRIDAGEGIHRVDKTGCEYWLYRLDGARPERPVIQLPLRQSPERASPDVLHRVYAALLDSLTLSNLHRANLRRRGLPDDEITHRDYRTMPVSGRAALARRLVERYGAEVCSRVPGIYVKTESGRSWWSLSGSPGLLIPVRDEAGHIIAMMVRADEPDADPRYRFISSARHGGPGPLMGVHIPLNDVEHGGTIRVTEGTLKADVATCLDGIMSVGLSAGVCSWRQALPTIQAIGANTAVVAFDMDARVNFHVAQALRQCVRGLQAEGLRVKLEIWSERYKGVDDALANGHQPRVIEGRDMLEHIRSTLHSAWTVHLAQRARRAVETDDHRARSIEPLPDDPWAGRSTLPIRPYTGYRGARLRMEVRHG
jgi:hypothetical protein